MEGTNLREAILRDGHPKTLLSTRGRKGGKKGGVEDTLGVASNGNSQCRPDHPSSRCTLSPVFKPGQLGPGSQRI